MSDIATLNRQLDDMILQGQAMDAFEQYYADDVVMVFSSREEATRVRAVLQPVFGRVQRMRQWYSPGARA